MYLGLMQNGYGSIADLLEKLTQNNYEVITIPVDPIDFPNEIDERNPLKNADERFIYSDLILSSSQWSSKVIIMLSDQLDCDSSDQQIRKKSECVLQQQISWIDHLHYSGYSLIKLKHGNNSNLAHIITKKIKGILLIQVPLYNASLAHSIWRQDLSESALLDHESKKDSWHWWNQFRWSCDFHSKIRVVLELHEDELPDLETVRRWLGEPLEAVILPTALFILNSANYPVLPKQWQKILQYFVKAQVNIILSADVTDNRLKQISHYLKNFEKSHLNNHILQGYEDILETPLQPLYDNLDSYTYEVFERDPIKYKLYQDAITKALEDRVSDAEVNTKVTIIMILGAGRGPLVRSALNAAENSGRKVRIYIIEKNPNAIRTLYLMVKKLWYKKDVHLFSKDMRDFKPPEQGDILVSELLGSFGDNELSPECLDCAQTLLKDDGISIPCKSVSYINPIMSSKLYNAMRQLVRSDCARSRDTYSDLTTSYSPVSSAAITKETNFVTLLKNIYNIDFPQPLFEFTHSKPDTKTTTDNSRYKILKFSVEMDCVIHGIAGYFEAVLYKDIILSINPATHTVSLLSWFPMYFPITQPLNLKHGETLEVHFWRCTTKQKVWYEWSLTAPVTTHIHNRNGHAFSIYCS